MKFAYMIMAHNEPYVLDKLIHMLDYPNNDIYIHVDAKSNLIDKRKLYTNSAGLVILPSRRLTWGASQIYVILDLITEALKTNHDYYHLISGVDLPLKNNFDMVEFFERNKGKELIGITPDWAESPAIAQRYKLHWLFQDSIGKKKNILYFTSRVITKVEKYLGFKREKEEDIHFFGGPEWFSITEQAAKYILGQGDWAKKRFRDTICSDEIYAQTIIGNSAFAEKIYNKESKDSYAECLRYVKFNRESPFVLSVNDYDNLVDSKFLFARKFGSKTSEQKELVDKIFELYK